MEILLINPREALVALQLSGIPDNQANAIVKIFKDININALATKSDIALLKNDIFGLMNEIEQLKRWANSEIVSQTTIKLYVLSIAIVGV